MGFTKVGGKWISKDGDLGASSSVVADLDQDEHADMQVQHEDPPEDYQDAGPSAALKNPNPLKDVEGLAVFAVAREISDHCALVVKSVEKDWGPKPFRSIDAWFLERGFNRMDVFGNLDNTKRRILQELEDLDCQDCNGGLGESERLKRMELASRLVENDKKLESLICQEARASWFNENSCTRFFHSSLRWRRLGNEVKGVKVGDQWCEEPSTVRVEAKKLFEARFRAMKDLGVRLHEVEFKSLTPIENESLVAMFTEEEIRDTMWQCEGSKSPRPDDFNFNFIRKSWEFIKDEIIATLPLFHMTRSIPKGL
ncbi:uncharacterized protein [Phaseolus vulgaris]|uniref:uncharacterized protein n=1 Tax=Phaseolus vulgaris TaxID=3885 RepID=UPI0035CB4A90